MTRLRNIILLIVFLSWTAGAQGVRSAKDIRLHNGMGTGQDYLRMPEPARPAYVMGLVNGLFLSPLFGVSRHRIAWLEACLEEQSGNHIAKILSRYLEQHPTEQHEQLHAISYHVLLQACPASPVNRRLKAR